MIFGPEINGIPQLGLGTYGRTGEAGLAALLVALEIGYRHIDTAQSYGTEANVGEAVRRSGLDRDDVFITTKVADDNLGRTAFLPSVERSIQTMGLGPIDLLLIHWPAEKDAVPFEDYMLALAEAQERGWAHLIGVSNYPIADLKRAEVVLGVGRLATDQVELHPYLQAPRLRDYAREVGLPLTAYRPLAKGQAVEDATLARIGKRHGVTGSATALAFLMQEGHIVIPASSSRARLVENFAACGVHLSAGEMAAIRGLDRGRRLVDPDKAPAWDD
jgi:2,5-diketo-D-gluconate reductase B